MDTEVLSSEVNSGRVYAHTVSRSEAKQTVLTTCGYLSPKNASKTATHIAVVANIPPG